MENGCCRRHPRSCSVSQPRNELASCTQQPRDVPDGQQSQPPSSWASASREAPCRFLWIAAVSIVSDCAVNDMRGYIRHYTAALMSVKKFASSSLRPILLLLNASLSHAPLVDEINEQLAWLEEVHGTRTVPINRLSRFQHSLISNGIPGCVRGAYTRLEIPSIVRKHGLFAERGICQQYVLYTDCDVMLTRPLDYMAFVASQPRCAPVAFGAEFRRSEGPFNTGGITAA